ncbi:MAG: DUF11 domain-containing protein, partial [Bacteroidota bacterium]
MTPTSLLSQLGKTCLLLLLFFWSSVALQAQHDVSITKTVSVDSAGVGDIVTFTITLNNDGGTNLTGVSVEHLLPPELQYDSDNAVSPQSYNSATGIWTIGNVPSTTASVSLEVQAQLLAPGVHTGIAQVHAMDGFDVDSAPDDDVITDDDYATACVSVPYKICTTFNDTVVLTAPAGYTMYQWSKDGTVIGGATDQVYKAIEAGKYTFTADDSVTGCDAGSCCPIQVDEACFDLALDKQLASGQSAIASPGDAITYTIRIHNQGDFFVDSILVTDYAASGLTNNSGQWVGNDTLLTIADGGLPTGGLAPGATLPINITLTIDGDVSADSLLNYAEISSAKDVSGTDNRDVDSTPDTDGGNDAGGLSGSPADNHLDGDGTGTALSGTAATDEDDHDPQVIYICPTITNPSADATVCSGDEVATISVSTTNADADGIRFVSYTSQQTGTAMYTNIGSGTILGTVTASSGTASITNVSFPANNTTSPVTYYVYAIINPTPSASSCRPFQEIEVTVNPLPTASVAGTTTICSGDAAPDFTFSGTPNAVVTYNIDGGANTTITLDGSGDATLAASNTASSTVNLVSVENGST